MQHNSNNIPKTSIAVLFSNHRKAFGKVQTKFEKRGKSNINEINKVMRKIAVKDLDYLRERLTDIDSLEHENDRPVENTRTVVGEPFDE